MGSRSFARPSFAARPQSAPPSFAGRRFHHPGVAGARFINRGAADRRFVARSAGGRGAMRSHVAGRGVDRSLRGSRLSQRELRAIRSGQLDRGGRLATRRGLDGTRGTTALRAISDRHARRGDLRQQLDARRAMNPRLDHRLATAERGAALRGLAVRPGVFGRADRHAAMQTYHRRDWHHHWRRHRTVFSGWVGPLFWPYAYDDVFYDTVWGYGFDTSGEVYDDAFWSYGYADIYGGLFSPYGYDDMVAMGPAATRSAARTSQDRSRATRIAARSRGDADTTGSTGVSQSPGWKQMCGEDSRDVIGLPIERIRDVVRPDDAQRALLDRLGDASVEAAQAVKSACPSDYSLTPPGRLAAMEQRLRGLRGAVDIMRAPLDAFYASLSDEQKARLNAVGQGQATAGQPNRPRSIAQDCSAASAASEWPSDRLDRTLRPTEAQRASLAKLREAAEKAATTLAGACPTETPATPPARLAAMAARLDAMITAVTTVRGAVTDVYGTLSDEQKAQFNTFGQVQ
jgi:hypothetical protein